MLLPGGQNMNATNLHVLSNVADAPQAILDPVSQVRKKGNIYKAYLSRLANILIIEMTVWML